MPTPLHTGALGGINFSMRKLLPALALVASAVSVPVFAADWVFIGSGVRGENYIDRESIRQAGRYKQAWSRGIPRVSEFEKWLVLREFDCDGRRTRDIELIGYYPNGQTISGEGERVWAHAPPETSIEGELDYVCFGRLPQ